MAIVSISQIKHRRGNLEDLPQLASGELGWAIDARKLYIGNGNTTEGAPEIGNTEILTEYSDIIALLTAYTYKGTDAGYTVSTGLDANSPTTRSIQQKLDDFVNVKDFGATGDGTTDDTDAINRALYELYCRDGNLISNAAVRRALYFPAGMYIVSDPVLIPPYATLRGAGLDCTVIKQITASTVVAKVVDSLQQEDAAQGNNSATLSQYIEVNGITFKQADTLTGDPAAYTNIEDVFIISTGLQIAFANCKFEGPFVDHSTTNYINLANPDGVSNKACFRLNSPTGISGASYNVTFRNCEFSSHTYGITVQDTAVYNVCMDQCYFSYLYSGVNVDTDPVGVRITNSLFNYIYSQAIYSSSAGVVSAFNTFLDVGVNFLGIASTTAVSPVIEYNSDDCSSICDYFARSSTAQAMYPNVEYNDNSVYTVTPGSRIQYGNYCEESGRVATLTDNTSGNTFLTFDTNKVTGAFIDYSLTRGTTKAKTGTLVLSVFNSNATVDDNNTDNGSNPQVSFSTNVVGSDVDITYDTTSGTGNNAIIKYRIRYFI